MGEITYWGKVAEKSQECAYLKIETNEGDPDIEIKGILILIPQYEIVLDGNTIDMKSDFLNHGMRYYSDNPHDAAEKLCNEFKGKLQVDWRCDGRDGLHKRLKALGFEKIDEETYNSHYPIQI